MKRHYFYSKTDKTDKYNFVVFFVTKKNEDNVN